MAITNPIATQAAAGTGMLRVRAWAAWVSMSAASQAYPIVITPTASRTARQNRRATGSRPRSRRDIWRTDAVANAPPIGTKTYANASVPAPMVR